MTQPPLPQAPLLYFFSRSAGWGLLLLFSFPLAYQFLQAEGGSLVAKLWFGAFALCSGLGLAWSLFWLMGKTVGYHARSDGPSPPVRPYSLPRWMRFPLAEVLVTAWVIFPGYLLLADPPPTLQRQVMLLIGWTLFWGMVLTLWLSKLEQVARKA